MKINIYKKQRFKMRYLKTFESYSVQQIDETFLGVFRRQAVIKEILADLEKERKNLEGEFNDYAASLGDRTDVAKSLAPSVAEFLSGKIGAEEVNPEDVAKVVLKAKVVKKNDKGEWDNVGKYGGIEGGTGAEGGWK